MPAPLVPLAPASPVCLSCGEPLKAGRRYCSVACRQRLREKLNRRTGLLKALNIRYASFYFTADAIILDLLPQGVDYMYSFFHPRCSARRPEEAFCRLADRLGRIWWQTRSETRRRYKAGQHLLTVADRRSATAAPVIPLTEKRAARVGNALACLKLSAAELDSPAAMARIKAAYRNRALDAHPDRGGDAATFRRIHDAYHQLLSWTRDPTFSTRMGFPDKWFYDGRRNRWVQPTGTR